MPSHGSGHLIGERRHGTSTKYSLQIIFTARIEHAIVQAQLDFHRNVTFVLELYRDGVHVHRVHIMGVRNNGRIDGEFFDFTHVNRVLLFLFFFAQQTTTAQQHITKKKERARGEGEKLGATRGDRFLVVVFFCWSHALQQKFVGRRERGNVEPAKTAGHNAEQ